MQLSSSKLYIRTRLTTRMRSDILQTEMEKIPIRDDFQVILWLDGRQKSYDFLKNQLDGEHGHDAFQFIHTSSLKKVQESF